LHQNNQLPNQDYADFVILNESTLIGAVSDGSGSAKHSEEGAQVAVKTSVDYLTNNAPELTSEAEINTQLTQLVTQVREDLEKKAQELDCRFEDLACTLMVFMATPQRLAAMQIGDGFMVIRPLDNDFELLFTPDKGEYANETYFITAQNAEANVRIKTLEEEISFICVATDGLEKVAIKIQDYQPFTPFFTPLEQYLLTTSNLETDEYLEQFLNSERLNAKTQDDKTILLGLLSDHSMVTDLKEG
jgi:serine/threonine protein phosphatase PrpC